jgi:hypothetical protein
MFVNLLHTFESCKNFLERRTAWKNRVPKHRMRDMKQSVPKSVDEYIAAQPEALRPKLEQVRAAIRRAVPEAVEGIGYRMPGYKLNSGAMSCERARSIFHSPNRFR